MKARDPQTFSAARATGRCSANPAQAVTPLPFRVGPEERLRRCQGRWRGLWCNANMIQRPFNRSLSRRPAHQRVRPSASWLHRDDGHALLHPAVSWPGWRVGLTRGACRHESETPSNLVRMGGQNVVRALQRSAARAFISLRYMGFSRNWWSRGGSNP